MIKRKQKDLLSLQSQTAKGVTQLLKVSKRLNLVYNKKRKNLTKHGEVILKKLKTASKDEKTEQYTDSRESKWHNSVITS
jgi:hypothetical protein